MFTFGNQPLVLQSFVGFGGNVLFLWYFLRPVHTTAIDSKWKHNQLHNMMNMENIGK